jgi:hypothetical protein
MRKLQDSAFPNHKVLDRSGSREELVQRMSALCERADGWADVAVICRSLAISAPESIGEVSQVDNFQVGYVYLALMKVGREKRYKIGKADIVGRRTKQVGVNLPEELELVHVISTDDAYGIEGYWHKRFAGKRRGGEWFELSAAEVRVFKRRKFM